MATKTTSKKAAKEKKPQKQENKDNKTTYIAAVAIVVILVAIIYYAFTTYPIVSVPFSSFKSGFLSAPRIALTISYSNDTQFAAMNPCLTNTIQFIAHNRNASTIDFFIINQANSTCIYSPTGLGHPISNISTQSASRCLAVANSEPGVFLNYSNSNSTTVTLSHLYVYGNSAYMAQCPIAQDLG